MKAELQSNKDFLEVLYKRKEKPQFFKNNKTPKQLDIVKKEKHL